MLIVVLSVEPDLGEQLAHAGEGVAPDGLLGDEGEPAFDRVEPRGTGRSEVQVKARPAGEPRPHLRMFVTGVIVEDQMDGERRRHVGLHFAQKGEELLMPVARLAAGEDLTVGDIERGEERGG